MSELCFTSSLSMEEIEENFKDVNYFEGLMGGLQETLAFERGEMQARTRTRTSDEFAKGELQWN